MQGAYRRGFLSVVLLCLAATGWLSSGRVDAADSVVYADALDADWANWSWGSTINVRVASPRHGGAYAMSVRYDAGWAGLYLHSYSGYDTTRFDRLSFWIHGGTTGNQRLNVIANGDANHIVAVRAQANTWTQVTIPLASLGSPAQLTELYWQDATGAAQPVYYLDDIALLASTAPPPAAPTLTIDAGSGRHPISDDIYGMNFPDEDLAAELRLPVARWGGNATTRYNWRTSMTNTAGDWYFENLPSGTVAVANLPNGSASDQFVDQNRRTGTRSLLTVPLIGWTVKATSPRVHPYDCAFKVSRYGSQQSIDSWDHDCGNGLRTDGSVITGNQPSDTSDAIGPDFVRSWLAHLTGRYGAGGNGGVAYYNLDNEPMLWNSTHRDVHPAPVGYDELRSRTLAYGAAIKAADPTAKTLGPVLWGWCAYFYSAQDGCGPGADYRAHGNLDLVPWYLGQARAYEQQTGLRILDYLDLHYYPQANGVALAGVGSAATAALRLRSTRALWDPAYIDESWISDTAPGGVAVRLIPRMRAWVDTWYPGTRLAITEYNWGGLEGLNGALAQADVLGIFGREGLDLATLWSPPAATDPGAFAFRLYRNYDGTGQGFGDSGVLAASSDQGRLAVYAAERTADRALTLMVINKTAAELTSPVTIGGWTLPAQAQVYRYSAANLTAIARVPDQPLADLGFTAAFPANSATLFVIPWASTPAVTLTVSLTGTGVGTVTASPGSLFWNGPTGTAAYTGGSAVTLTAAATTGSSFTGWSGCDSASGTRCAVTMATARTVTAAFALVPCTYGISPTAKSFSKTGGTGSVTTTASAASCQWTARSNVSWVTLAATAYTGSRNVTYNVAKNTTGKARSGTLTIAGKTFTVSQSK